MVQTVTSEAEFQKVISGAKPALVDFTASWCGPCRAIAPKFESLSQQYQGKIEFLKSIARSQMVSAMPTFLLYVKGKREEQVVGADISKLTDICRRYADYAPTFSGTGRRLSEAGAATVPQADQASPPSTSAEPANIVADSSAPVTTLQIRMADGSRHVAKFNTTSTIGELRRYISSKTAKGSQSFNLMAGMPPTYVTTDESVTLEKAELEGAVVIQRPA